MDLSNTDVPFSPHSETMPSVLMAFPVGDPILYVTPSNRLMNLSSESLVFSSGFFKTQVYSFYSITAPTNAIDKSIIIIFESRVVLTLK